MAAPRTFGLAKLVEAALHAPAHRPKVRCHHLIEEWRRDGDTVQQLLRPLHPRIRARYRRT